MQERSKVLAAALLASAGGSLLASPDEQNDERGERSEAPILPVVEYKDNEAAKLRRYDLARTVLKKRPGTVGCEVCLKPISANARWCMKCYARICEQVATIEEKEAAK